jgi:steroid Delta-isomerase
MRLLDDHVQRFNEGVRSGNFAPMAAGFTEDAEMHFEGVPVGPFFGREAIAAAYRDQPPDDEIEILGAAESDGVVVARYACCAITVSRQARCGSLRRTGA